MTMRTAKGQSLSEVAQAAKNKADWAQKLDRNLRSTLNRIGNVATIGPSTYRSPGSNVVLYYDGTADAKQRIEKVLETELTTNSATPVKISRLNVNVVLKQQRRAA